MGFTGMKWTNQEIITIANQEIITIAKQDGSRKTMAKLHHGAYRAAIRRNLLDNIHPYVGKYPEYIITQTHKSCSNCKKVKELKQFHSDKSQKSNKMSHCKDCKKNTKNNTKQNLKLKNIEKNESLKEDS